MLLLQILEKLIGLQNEALTLEKTCKKESKVSSAVWQRDQFEERSLILYIQLQSRSVKQE